MRDTANVRRGASRGPRLGYAMVVVFLALACADSPTGVPNDPDVRSVEVGPAGRVVVVGDTIRYTAVAKAADGSSVGGVPITWSTSDDGTATVSGQGASALVTAIDAGTVRVIASAGDRQGWVFLTVAESAPVPATIDISPAEPSVTVGGRIQLTAVLRTADGEAVEGPEITWSSQAPWIAQVAAGEGNGRIYVNALQAGSAVIVARSQGLEYGIRLTVVSAEPAVATLEVRPANATLAAGQQVALEAVLKAADGTVIEGREITWRSLAPATASVLPGAVPGYAVVTARQAGDVAVVASGEGLEASAQLTVTPGVLLSALEMRPAALLVERGETVTLGVHGWGSDGSWFPDVPASWVSSDPTVVRVQGAGPTTQLTGVREGTAEVTAAAGGVSVRASIRVKTAGNVGYVIVSPTTPRMWAGSLFRLTARTLGTSGGELPDQPIAWTVEDPTVATIEADGLLLAHRAGTTRVSARSGGKEGSVTIRVYAQPVDGLMLDLRPQEDPSGGWRPAPQLPDTVWTDPTGATHVAHRFLVEGTLEIALNGTSTWQQRLEVETVVALPTGTKVVGRTAIYDSGPWLFHFQLPWHFFFQSSASPGTTFEGSMAEAGRMIVQQSIAGTPVNGYVWMLR